MSNIIDSIRLSGTVYTIAGGSGGNPTVELTQAEYDDLVSAGTVSPTTYYIITDAQPTDISLYWTSAQTKSAITKAVSGKQDTLSAGTNITIVDNVISATGGGKAISAGRGIEVTSGETADTISCTLPISATTEGNVVIGSANLFNSHSGNLNFYFGSGCYIQSTGVFGNHSQYNVLFGLNNNSTYEFNTVVTANALFGRENQLDKCSYGLVGGYYNRIYNNSEFASGQFNNSVTASTTFGDSGNTLFSVGNGTADNARHNAFEIRQNGDIYCNNGTSDVKLQDYLQIKVVKITQAAYDALSPDYDNNVLYVIV